MIGLVTEFVYRHNGVCFFEFLPNGSHAPTIMFEVGWETQGTGTGVIRYATYGFKFDGFEFNNIVTDTEMQVFIGTCQHAEVCAVKIRDALINSTEADIQSKKHLEEFLRKLQ